MFSVLNIYFSKILAARLILYHACCFACFIYHRAWCWIKLIILKRQSTFTYTLGDQAVQTMTIFLVARINNAVMPSVSRASKSTLKDKHVFNLCFKIYSRIEAEVEAEVENVWGQIKLLLLLYETNTFILLWECPKPVLELITVEVFMFIISLHRNLQINFLSVAIPAVETGGGGGGVQRVWKSQTLSYGRTVSYRQMEGRTDARCTL